MSVPYVHGLGVTDLEEVDRLRLQLDKLALGQARALYVDRVAVLQLEHTHHLGKRRAHTQDGRYTLPSSAMNSTTPACVRCVRAWPTPRSTNVHGDSSSRSAAVSGATY